MDTINITPLDQNLADEITLLYNEDTTPEVRAAILKLVEDWSDAPELPIMVKAVKDYRDTFKVEVEVIL